MNTHWKWNANNIHETQKHKSLIQFKNSVCFVKDLQHCFHRSKQISIIIKWTRIGSTATQPWSGKVTEGDHWVLRWKLPMLGWLSDWRFPNFLWCYHQHRNCQELHGMDFYGWAAAASVMRRCQCPRTRDGNWYELSNSDSIISITIDLIPYQFSSGSHWLLFDSHHHR